jgi:hypothetical protein
MKIINLLIFTAVTIFISCRPENRQELNNISVSSIDTSLKKTQSSYQISSVDSSQEEIIIKSVITDRLNKEELITITYSEKKKRNWDNKFVMYFFLNSTNNPAYATALYRKNCSDCNSIDPSNNKINLNLNLGEGSQSNVKAFEIPNEINKELFVVAFYEEVWKSSSFIVYDNKKKNKATKIMYLEDGSITKRKLIPESEISFREIFEDFPEDKPHYKITNEFVEYVQTDGKVGYTYPILGK